MAWCEQNRFDYLLGLARNTRLLAEAVEKAARPAGPRAAFKDLTWADPKHPFIILTFLNLCMEVFCKFRVANSIKYARFN